MTDPMYAIYANIYHQYTPVMLALIYQHHGSYGIWEPFHKRTHPIRLEPSHNLPIHRWQAGKSKNPEVFFAEYSRRDIQKFIDIYWIGYLWDCFNSWI